MPEFLIIPLAALTIIGTAVLQGALSDLLHLRKIRRHEGGERWIAEHPSLGYLAQVSASTLERGEWEGRRRCASK